MNASAFSEPATPRGVAGFAGAKFTRLLLAQFLVALFAAVVVAWFFYENCFPVVLSAIQNLPADSEIRSAQLDWTGTSPQSLAEGHFIAFDVDLDHSGQLRSAADFQVEFGRNSVRVISFFGYYSDLPYPGARGEIIDFNRPTLEPLWNAWRAEILFGIAGATIVALLLSWWALATIYFLPIWLTGFFTNRDLSVPGSWKLSNAALLPGAILMTAGIFIYGLGFPFVLLAFVFGAHLVLGWLYLFFALAFFARTSAAPSRGNPFEEEEKPKL
jgi:hypothetical protein